MIVTRKSIERIISIFKNIKGNFGKTIEYGAHYVQAKGPCDETQDNTKPTAPAPETVHLLAQTATYPLNTCCCPRLSPVTVVSLRRVFSPLSTETWAMPAPISPAPRMASCLEGQDGTVLVNIPGTG